MLLISPPQASIIHVTPLSPQLRFCHLCVEKNKLVSKISALWCIVKCPQMTMLLFINFIATNLFHQQNLSTSPVWSLILSACYRLLQGYILQFCWPFEDFRLSPYNSLSFHHGTVILLGYLHLQRIDKHVNSSSR